MLKQRLDFPFENKIETMDSLAKMHGQKKCWKTGQIFHLKSKLKLFIDSQKSKAKKLLTQWLDFHLKTRLKLWIAWLKCTAKKIVETTVRFFIWKQNWNYG